MPYAFIKFVDPRTGQPVDPDFGVESGTPGHPDQGLPPDPAYPSTGPIYGGGHPSTGPIYGGGRPDNGLPWAPVRPDGSPILPPRPWPPLPWPPRPFPPGPTDPDWGVGGGPPTHPSQPIYIPPTQIDNELPTLPGAPDQGLPGGSPGVPSHPIAPPTDPPPGTIWPPIAGLPDGKCALLAWFYRLGWRYVVVDASLAPGTPLPPTPEPK